MQELHFYSVNKNEEVGIWNFPSVPRSGEIIRIDMGNAIHHFLVDIVEYHFINDSDGSVLNLKTIVKVYSHGRTLKEKNV